METIKGILDAVLRFVTLFGVLVLFGAAAPLLAFVPFVYVLLTQNNLGGLVFVYIMFLGPVASSFWMILLANFPSWYKAHLAGKSIEEWREEHGGIVCTVGKGIGFMLLGLFGSMISGTIFCAVRYYLSIDPLLFWMLAPFATFAPVLLLLYRRRSRPIIRQERPLFTEEELAKCREECRERVLREREARALDTKFLKDLHIQANGTS